MISPLQLDVSLLCKFDDQDDSYKQDHNIFQEGKAYVHLHIVIAEGRHRKMSSLDLKEDRQQELDLEKLERDTRVSRMQGRYDSSRSTYMLMSKIESEVAKLDMADRLEMDPRVKRYALWAMRFGIFADAANARVLTPNYALLAWPGADPESFPSTAPLGFATANYFIPLASTLGILLSSAVVGKLSDKYGRKPFMLLFLFAGAGGSIAKWLVRRSFWGFCAANFVNGIFAGTYPLALAYASDMFPRDKLQSDSEQSTVTAVALVGATGGGLIAIAFEFTGLFAPLWVSATLSACAGCVCWKWMVEPSKAEKGNPVEDAAADADGDSKQPEEADPGEAFVAVDANETLDKRAMCNILLGSLTDNLGSAGIIPLAFAPLLFDVYYGSFIDEGLEPIMSQNAFRFIFVFITLAVIPGAIASPVLFARFGIGFSAVFANIITGGAIVALLQIATATSPTSTTYGLFVGVLYLAFPLTVISQLTTAPMLERIAPPDKRGHVQSLNATFLNIGLAVGPLLLGLLADSFSFEVCFYTAAAISVFAAMVNAPLAFDARFKASRQVTMVEKESEAMMGDDEIAEMAKAGHWVPRRELTECNRKRQQQGQSPIMAWFGRYNPDEDTVSQTTRKQHVLSDYLFYKNQALGYLCDTMEDKDRRELCVALNNENENTGQDEKDARRVEMGEWIAEYLEDNGYTAEIPPSLIKHLIMRSFSPLNKTSGLYTEANCQERLEGKLKFLNNFRDIQDEAEHARSHHASASAMKLLLSESTKCAVGANMR